MKFARAVVAIAVTIAVVSAFGFARQETVPLPPVTAQGEHTVPEEPFPPIDNMHHFMEYLCQPSYRSLHDGLATEPANRREWRPLKTHALILAESMAIVAARVPEAATDAQIRQWQQMSRDVYDSGKALYLGIGDYEKSKRNFGKMIDNCNRCHDAFEEGKHQLEK